MEPMQRTQVAAVVLQGTPIRSPKRPGTIGDPLAPIAGRSVTAWVVEAVLGASIRRIAVVGSAHHAGDDDDGLLVGRPDRALIERVRPAIGSDSLETLGRAVDRLVGDFDQRARTQLLLLAAEAPQIEAGELRALVADHIASGASASVLGAIRAEFEELPIDPVVTYGVDGQIGSIVEPLVSGGTSVFGAICVQADLLIPALRRVTPSGWRHGPMIHDALHALEEVGHVVNVIPREIPLRPIDSARSRAPVEAELRRRIVTGWLERGVVIDDPDRVVIDAGVTLGHEIRIRPGTILEGGTVIGDGAVVGPNSHLVDTVVGTGAIVAHTIGVGHEVPAHEVVPPFSVFGDLSG